MQIFYTAQKVKYEHKTCEYQQRLTDLPDTRVTHTVSVVAVGLKLHENGTLEKEEGSKLDNNNNNNFFFV